jgi:nucleoid DNA-binding protein
MKTKSELVKIIAEKADVADNVAKELFDFFLSKIADTLGVGDTAKFSNIGYFHLRKGKIKKVKPNRDSEKIEYLDLVIFSSSPKLDIGSIDNLVFSVPQSTRTEQNKLDSHFSLSVGKPVLSQLQDKDSLFNTQNLANDVNRMLDTKANNLLTNLNTEDKLRSDSEIILVDMNQISSDEIDLNLDEEATKKNFDNASETNIHSSDNLKNKATDFGKDLSELIEEETIPDKDEEKYIEIKENNVTSWNFGKRYWGNNQSSEIKNKIELDIVNHQEESDEESISDVEKKTSLTGEDSRFIEQTVQEELKNHTDSQSTPDEKNIGNYKRVRSFSQDLSNESSPKKMKKISGLFKKMDTLPEKISEKNEPVKFIRKTELIEGETEISDELNETVIKDDQDEEIKFNRSEIKKRKKEIKHKSTGRVFFIFFVAIVIISAGLYFLYKNRSEQISENKTDLQNERTQNTTFIERSYVIPVTFPYEKSTTEIQITGIDESILAKTEEQTEKIQKVEKKSVLSPINKKLPETSKQVATNIYNYGNTFIVQVSAFRSKKDAQIEAARYTANGYNAFTEDAIVKGRAWFRVRVGNFKTLEEAIKFRNSN